MQQHTAVPTAVRLFLLRVLCTDMAEGAPDPRLPPTGSILQAWHSFVIFLPYSQIRNGEL